MSSSAEINAGLRPGGNDFRLNVRAEIQRYTHLRPGGNDWSKGLKEDALYTRRMCICLL